MISPEGTISLQEIGLEKIKSRINNTLTIRKPGANNIPNKQTNHSPFRKARNIVGTGLVRIGQVYRITGGILNKTDKGIRATSRFTSKTFIKTGNVFQKSGKSLIKHGARFTRSDSKIKKTIGKAIYKPGLVLHTVGTGIKGAGKIAMVPGYISRYTIRPLGKTYQTIGKGFEYIGNKIRPKLESEYGAELTKIVLPIVESYIELDLFHTCKGVITESEIENYEITDDLLLIYEALSLLEIQIVSELIAEGMITDLNELDLVVPVLRNTLFETIGSKIKNIGNPKPILNKLKNLKDKIKDKLVKAKDLITGSGIKKVLNAPPGKVMSVARQTLKWGVPIHTAFLPKTVLFSLPAVPLYGVSYISGKLKNKSELAKKLHNWSKKTADSLAFPIAANLYAIKGGYHQLMAEYNYWKYKRLKNQILKAVDIKDYKNRIIEVKDRKQLEKIFERLKKKEKKGYFLPNSYKSLMRRLEIFTKYGKNRIRLNPDEFEAFKNMKKDLKRPIVKKFKKHVQTLKDMGLHADIYRSNNLSFNLDLSNINLDKKSDK